MSTHKGCNSDHEKDWLDFDDQVQEGLLHFKICYFDLAKIIFKKI